MVLQSLFSLEDTQGHSHVTCNGVSSDLPCRDISVKLSDISVKLSDISVKLSDISVKLSDISVKLSDI